MLKTIFSWTDYLLPKDLESQVDLSILFRARFAVVSSLVGIIVLILYLSGVIYLDLSIAIKVRTFFAILILLSVLIVLKSRRNNFELVLNVGTFLQIFLLMLLVYTDTYTGQGLGFFSLIWLIPLFIMSAFYFKPQVGILVILTNVFMILMLIFIREGNYFHVHLTMPNFEGAFLLTLTLVIFFSSFLAFFIIQLNEILKDELNKQKGLLEESAKFQSLGQMASNLAHDVNNPLFTIQGKLHQMRNLLSQDRLDLNKCDSFVEEVEETILKLSQIVKGISTFARQGTGDQMVSVNVEELIQGIILLANYKIKLQNITLTVDVEPQTYLICYPSYISQVLINLINNASDALESVDNKIIQIQAFVANDFVEIHVRDNGLGVDPSIEKKIFESFYTTKKVGMGTGLGLSISSGLVKLHDGTLSYSRQGNMTDFTIKLPSYE